MDWISIDDATKYATITCPLGMHRSQLYESVLRVVLPLGTTHGASLMCDEI